MEREREMKGERQIEGWRVGEIGGGKAGWVDRERKRESASMEKREVRKGE